MTSQPHSCAGFPAPVLQEIRDRREHVRHASPDVLAAVAVEIDRKRDEVRRHELRLAHRAGPRADHLVARDVALLQNLQRGDQLVAEVIGAIADRDQRGERADHVEAAVVGAERGLDAPQRQDDPAVDAILLLDRIERRLPLARLARCALDARRRRDAREIGGDRHAVFGLAHRQRGDARVGRQARKGQIEGLARDAARRRVRPERCEQRREALGYSRLVLGECLRAKRHKQPKPNQKACELVRLRRHSIHV